MIVYVIGSLRNQQIVDVGNALRAAGHEAYDSWFAGGRESDDEWQRYCQRRGMTYVEAATDWHARQVFEMDLRHLKRADAAVLVYPAGRSAHVEFGWFVKDKPAFILIDGEPERYDVMPPNFAMRVCASMDELLDELSKLDDGPSRRTVDHAPWNA